jgi:hypothetical protein
MDKMDNISESQQPLNEDTTDGLAVKLYETLLKCEYARNNNGQHEKLVEDILIKLGFTQLPDINIKKDTILNITSLENKLHPGSYIAQPCGSQSSPDFIVRLHRGKIIHLECKSTKNNKPTFNSGGCKSHMVYLLSSEKYKETTMFVGSSIITHEQQGIIDDLIISQNKLAEIANERLNAIDANNRGISYYTRPMICQSGDSSKTDYFTHANRKECEKEVLEYFLV